jgi:hypothetical protein
VRILKGFFAREAKRIADEAAKHLEEATKADQEQYEPDLSGWVVMTAPIAQALHEEFMSSIEKFVASGIELKPDDMLVLDKRAQEFAHARGAELVGMRLVDGQFVPNPNPKWAITESTRTTIRELVEEAFTEGYSPRQLRDEIEEHVAFSRDRALMVARTELARAHVRGGLDGAKAAGVATKRWVINPESPTAPVDDCGLNATAGDIPLDSKFPSGDDGPPQHPSCQCTVVFGFGSSELEQGA